MAISPGIVIAARYKIVRLLGEGGFGAVYLAEDIRLGNKRVAVKESFDNSVEAQEQFRLEAQLLANLQHASLPRVTDHFLEPDGRQFLVMDYIEGEDLDERVVNAQRPLAEREAAALMLQVCEAVAYLHTRRPQPIIHRDIKPPNIKITADGRAVLVDFGIAKLYHPSKGTARVAKAVTPHFSPPEQYIGKTDARSDVYSLGATLYCLVSVALPPDAMDRITHGAPLAPPSQVNPAISACFEQIVLQALDLDPERRFQNANRMAAAIKSFLNLPPAYSEATGIICPCCGWQNRPGARYCARDGAPLAAAPGPAHSFPRPIQSPPIQPRIESVRPEMLFEIANAFARKNDFVQAIPRYEACLQQNFTHQAIYHNLGFSYLSVDRPGEAANILEKGAQRYPQDADIQFQLARAYIRQNLLDKAVLCAGRACQLSPKDPVNFRLHGNLLLDARRYPEAIRQLEKSVQLDPGSAATHILLGRAYGEAKDLKRAVSELRRAAQMDSQTSEPHLWMGLYYHMAKKYREAISALENVLQMDPTLALAHYMIAESHLQLDQYQKALPHYQKAVLLSPQDPDHHTRLGLCYALLSRKSEAIAALRQALNIDPAHQAARELLGKI